MVERFLLGSVSQSVALHAECSVEIVRNPEFGNRKMKILLAIDGSEQSEAAVDEVGRQHFPENSEVRIISVIEPAYYPTTLPWEGIDMEIYKQIEKHALMRALETVQKASAKIQAVKGSRQLTITTKELSGSPKSVILEEAEAFGADLIVVGSHGHGSVERFLLGSVSQAVALHAKCSVEIVRSPRTRAAENVWD
jgi:nucleotide-binding universal stress UspA family protein